MNLLPATCAALILLGAVPPAKLSEGSAAAHLIDRASCQDSTQVSSVPEIVCGELTLCQGDPGAQHGCDVVTVQLGEITYYEWCDCRQPESFLDSQVCHAAIRGVGSFLTRTCLGSCDNRCELEIGSHKYKRCTCQ